MSTRILDDSDSAVKTQPTGRNLVNIKNKRKRNLLKKSIALSKMCNMDITLFMHDRKYEKVYQYCSGKESTGETFTLHKAVALLDRYSKQKKKNITVYTDENLAELSTAHYKNMMNA